VKPVVLVMDLQQEPAILSSRVQDRVEKLWFPSCQPALLVAVVVLVAAMVVLVAATAVLADLELQELLTRRVECLFRDRKWFRQQAALQERQ